MLMGTIGRDQRSVSPWDSSSGTELEYPDRIVEPGSWLGHVPFAFWLIEALQPKVVVELGVHTGNSYCAFLQAIHRLGLDARCFGVDHWKGDEHAGLYGEEVIRELRAYHDPRYGAFSTLLRTSFLDALPYFSDGTIDLLHIDGFHSYEAVAADFASWRCKMSARGIVLFHDINVRERGFGIWRFWEELSAQFPHFEFLHSHGLGVVYLGSETLSGPLEALFSTASNGEAIQRYFSRLGASITERLAAAVQAAEPERLRQQLTEIERAFHALEDQVRDRDGRIAAAAGEIRRLIEEVAGRDHRLGVAEGQLKHLREEVARRDQRLLAVEAKLGRLEAEHQARLVEIQRELSSAKAMERHAADLQAELTALRSTHEREISQVLDLRDELAKAKLQTQVSSQIQQQQLARTILLQRELLSANLEKRVYQGQVEELLQSTSWRLSLPLRKASTELRRLKAAAGGLFPRGKLMPPSR